MPSYVQVSLVGLSELLLHLHELAGQRTNQVIRRALSKASRPMLQQAKNNTALLGDYHWTGTLKASLGLRDRVFKNGMGALVVIGARANHKREAVEQGSGRKVLRNPTKYMHLVEKGHRKAVGGKLPRTIKPGEHPAVHKARNAGATGHSAGFVDGIPILKMAFDSCKDQVLSDFTTEIEDYIFFKSRGGSKGP